MGLEAVAAVPKEAKAEHWGRLRWRLAPLKGGGYGATCLYHKNLGENRECKKNLNRKGIDCNILSIILNQIKKCLVFEV